MVLARSDQLETPAGADDWPDPTVDWWDGPLPVFRHLYNVTWLNERGAELAVVRWFIDEMLADDDWLGVGALEVGNVCGHYDLWAPVLADGVEVAVVDRYESGRRVRNLDVFDIEGSFDLIVSVSTLEHVRHDPPEDFEPDGAMRALAHLRSLLKPGGRMLVTVPTGHNRFLDGALASGATGAERACTLVRDMDGWRRTDMVECRPYGRTQPWAEAVWFGEFRA